MGITGLGKMLSKYTIPITLSTISESSVVIDASIYLYKFKYNSTTEQMVNKFSYQIKQLRLNSIKVIYIFDGKHNPLKQKVKDKRKENKTITVTTEDFTAFRDLLTSKDISFITAPTEAEKMCAYMNKIGYCDYVLSNDYDTLLFGCKKIIIYKEHNYFLLELDKILLDLNITLDNLIDIGIASGCDYASSGIKGLGPSKSIKLVKKGELKFDNVDFDYNIIKSLFTDFSMEIETTLNIN